MSSDADRLKLLLVDDDSDFCETVAEFLEGEGFQLDSAASVEEAQRKLSQHSVDLVLLDINLPGGSGLSIAASIRARDETPIIIISGRGEMIDRVVGLEIGADDYLPKPFELRELAARVRAVLRRSRAGGRQPERRTDRPEDRFAYVADLVFIPTRRRVETSDGKPVDLTAAEFALMAALVERPNRILTRDTIVSITRSGHWDGFDRSVDTLVSRLRRKLSQNTDFDGLIQTVRGEGYVLAAPVKWEN